MSSNTFDFAKESQKWRNHREHLEQSPSTSAAPAASPAPLVDATVELTEKLNAAEKKIAELAEQNRLQSVVHTYEKLELTSKITDMQTYNQSLYNKLKDYRIEPFRGMMASDQDKMLINLRSEVAVARLEAQMLREKVVHQNEQIAEFKENEGKVHDETVKLEVEAALALITMKDSKSVEELKEELREELRAEILEELNAKQKHQEKAERKELEEQLMDLELVCDNIQLKVYDMVLVEQKTPDDVPDYNVPKKVAEYVKRLAEKMQRTEAVMEEKCGGDVLKSIQRQVALGNLERMQLHDAKFQEAMKLVVGVLQGKK